MHPVDSPAAGACKVAGMNSNATLDLVKSPGLSTPPGYSHAAKVLSGRLVFIAGQVGLNERGELAGATFGEQAEQAFKNIGLALASVGATFEDVAKLNYYVKGVAQLPQIREIRDRYVDTSRPPVSTAVEVSALFRPEFLIEIEAVGVVRE